MNRYANHTDPELVTLLNRGDTVAFNIIYKRYSLGLYQYIFARVQDGQLSEDLVQNIFLSIWQQHSTCIIRNLNNYLYGAAKKLVLDYMRSAAVRKKYAAEFTQRMAGYYVDNSNAETQSLNDLNTAIETNLGKLPERYRTAFRLSRMEHLPIDQIAQRMKVRPRAVENYISGALRHLRGALGEFMVLVWWLVG